MISLDFSFSDHPTPELVGEGVVLRPPAMRDHAEWKSLREESFDHLTRWEQAWAPRDLSVEAYRIRLRSYARDARIGVGRSWFVVRAGDGALVGGVTLSDIRAAPFKSAIAGYWIGVPYLRQGLGAAALGAVISHAFGGLALNRLEAACQSDNQASRRLLGRCGFEEEGLARAYLFINGAWRDHLRFSRLAN